MTLRGAHAVVRTARAASTHVLIWPKRALCVERDEVPPPPAVALTATNALEAALRRRGTSQSAAKNIFVITQSIAIIAAHRMRRNDAYSDALSHRSHRTEVSSHHFPPPRALQRSTVAAVTRKLTV